MTSGQNWGVFGERAAWLLERDPRPQKEIAEKLGIPASRVSEWKTTTAPDYRTLRLIARAFPGVSVGWLVTGRGDPFYEGGRAEEKLAEIRQIVDPGFTRGSEGGGAVDAAARAGEMRRRKERRKHDEGPPPGTPDRRSDAG